MNQCLRKKENNRGQEQTDEKGRSKIGWFIFDLPLCEENGIMQEDTTDGRHVSVCGVHHMEYLEMADRLGRDFCKMQKFVPGWSFFI